MKNPAVKIESCLESRFIHLWMGRVKGEPTLVLEHEFAKPRKWRFDFAHRATKVAIEIEGGVHDGNTRGRHVRAEGFKGDCEKYNEAAFIGWIVFRLTADMITVQHLTRINKFILGRMMER